MKLEDFRGFCKELGANLGGIWLALIPFAFAFVLVGIAVNYGWLETNEHHYAHEHVPAMDDLAQSGGDVSEAGAVMAREALRVTVDFFAMKPALAHATARCTTSSGKVTNNTGFSRELTSWRFDRNGYRYTITRHQLLGQSGWHTVGRYFGKIAKSRC